MGYMEPLSTLALLALLSLAQALPSSGEYTMGSRKVKECPMTQAMKGFDLNKVS